MVTQVEPIPSATTSSAIEPVAFFGSATVPATLTRAALTDKGIFLVDGDLTERRLTYRALHESAQRVAAGLVADGVRPGDRVCLLSGTDEPLLRTLFGVWYAGAIPVLLPLPRRRGELDGFLADIGRRVEAVDARVLGVADAYAEFFQDLARPQRRVAAMSDLAAGGPGAAPPLPQDAQATALLQFTSGTTKSSRAVMLSHHNVLSNMAAVWHGYGVGPDEVGMTWLPLNHDMGIIGLLGCVARGNDVVVQSPEDFVASPLSWLSAISRYRVSLIGAPNFAYALAGRLLRNTQRKLDLSCLKWAVNGAEPIDVESLTAFTTAAARYGMRPTVPCPVFGLAEATLCVTMLPTDTPLAVAWVDRDALEVQGRAVPVEAEAPGNRRLVACGHPIPGTRLAIRAEDGSDLPDGHVGEIYISGQCVTSGYWNDPQGTEEILIDGWLRTGDLGYLGEQGLVVCGRRKDMIILNGRNIYPEDFEAEAEAVDGIRMGNTAAFYDHTTDRMILVAEGRVPAGQADALAQRLMDHLRRQLPVPPHEVLVCPASTVPKTTSGKRQRGRCRDLYLANSLPVLGRAARGAASGARSTGSAR
ncbi:AMP-binding protein [Streptomyces sp. SPB162]|uniref:AMP-binding protein n=1 Tax=Streptomyces sp. SPB162 TaxID=2940560 RepID=UPI002406EE34|nr:AMP-binding protein [Streptomyces sp. SPB162]MDF9817173.1 fatty-acyl-CoA synthase [Streptomyces sp. SPB162]